VVQVLEEFERETDFGTGACGGRGGEGAATVGSSSCAVQHVPVGVGADYADVGCWSGG
jgi:hypothetical protein